MGRYSNVDTSSLRTAANTALTELNSYNISNLGELGDCTFQGKANIRFALNSIQNGGLNGGIVLLRKKLNNLISACNEIDSYHEAEAELQSAKDKENGYHKVDSGKRDVLGKIIWSWKKNINTAEIAACNNKISKLEKEIDSLLS